jgi:hypothetical protein
LRDKLEAAAQSSGRSIAQEVEIRLMKSLDDNGSDQQKLLSVIESVANMAEKTLAAGEISVAIAIQACGGADLFPLWKYPAEQILRVQEKTGKSIREDEETRREAERAVLGAIVDVFRNIPPSLTDILPKDNTVLARLTNLDLPQS